MATQRREESERRAKRQGSGIRKEGGDEFKASPTRGRIKKEIFLRENVGNEIQTDISKNSKRSKQSD
jgi:hypothetical protein